MEIRLLKNIMWVLKNSNFSRKDKVEYIGFLLLAFMTIALLLDSIWYLRINFVSVLLTLFIIARGATFYSKFVEPFNKAVYGKEFAKRESTGVRWGTILGVQSLQATIKQTILNRIWGIFASIIVIGSAIVLIVLHVSFFFIFIIVSLEIAADLLIYLSVVKKIWAPSNLIVSSTPEGIKPSLSQKIVGWLIVLFILIFIIWRISVIYNW